MSQALPLLDAQALAAFHRDGFIAVDNLVRLEEVARIKTILLRLHETNVGFNEGAQFDAVTPSDGDPKKRRFPQILNPRIYAPELIETEYFQKGIKIARDILGDQARIKGDISFMKPSHIGSDTPWHQDDAFGNPAYDHREITIWLAVTPAGTENSCMSFIPGSHRYPVLEHRPIGGDPRIHALECVGEFARSAAVECPLSAGSCTIHTQRTLHYAGANNSKDFRLAYALLFDTPAVRREIPLIFAWSKYQLTARMVREQKWRRHGGMILHIWRMRHRISFRRLLAEIKEYVMKNKGGPRVT